MDNIRNFLDKYYDDILYDIKRITLIAAPSFKENNRIMFLKEYLGKFGYNNAEIDKEGNLKVALMGKDQRALIFSAHVDTIFSTETELKIKEDKGTIACPGICDNSTGIVALLYLMKYLKEKGITPANSVIFLFNVGEEGLGNLRGIRYFFDTTELKNITAHICIEGHQIGRLTKIVVGSHRLNIRVITQGGHSWRDFGNNNAIVIAAELIDRIMAIKLPKYPKTTLNIGIIKGGESVNSIPATTELSVEIRSINQTVLKNVTLELNNVIEYMIKKGHKLEANLLGDRPCGIMKHEWLVSKIRNVHKRLNIKTIEDIGSTDSNYPISLGLPSLTIGITEANNTHSIEERLVKEPIRKGLEQLILIFHELEQ